MKFTRLFAVLAVVAAAAGCSKEEPADMGNTGSHTGETYLTITAGTDATRTAIADDYSITWAEGDAIGLFYNTEHIKAEQIVYGDVTNTNGEVQNLKYEIEEGGAGIASAPFKIVTDDVNDHPVLQYTGNFKWQKDITDTELFAYYPYTYNQTCGHSYFMNGMPFNLPRTQGGTLADVAANDLAYASAEIAKSGDEEFVKGEADFRFKHVFSILEITVANSLSNAATIESVALTATDGTALTGDCILDFTADGNVLRMGQRANSSGVIDGTTNTGVVIKPAKGIELQKNASAKLYAVIAPADLTDATIRVTTSEGYQEFSVNDVTTEAGKYYTKELTLAQSDFTTTQTHTVTFEGDDFSKSVVYNVANGKYSTTDFVNKESWQFDESLYPIWTDPVTSLTTKSNRYPMFISSYNSKSLDNDTYGSYSHDLFVYNPDSEEFSTSGGGHNKSDNFLVGYGYYEEAWGDGRSMLTFNDKKARTIKSCWINYTCYFLNVVTNGNGLSPSLNDNEDCILTATGYDAEGRQVGEVQMTYARKGYLLDGWTEWDLSELGPVVTIKINISGGADNGYGFSLPAYYAIDDVTVEWEK